MADGTRNGHFSANINDESAQTRLTAVAFSCHKESKVSVVSLPDFRVSLSVLHAKHLLTWGLLYESPTYGASFISFSKGTGFSVPAPGCFSVWDEGVFLFGL